MRLDGKTALVTGATKGIGLAISRELAEHGAKVLLNYRSDAEAAKEALSSVQEASPDSQLTQADIGNPEDIERLFREVRETHGGLDLFVNNAGVAADGYAMMMGEAKWRKVIDTNLTGSFLACRAAGRLMVRQRAGAICAVSSTSGFAAPAGQANYAASKAGLVAMLRVLAKEFGDYGVRVNAVVPGFVDTAMTQGMPAEQLKAHLANVPLGRIGVPEDVAPMVRFLLSEEASYITGAAMVIDGGLTI